MLLYPHRRARPQHPKLTLDILNKWLSAGANLAVIIGVCVAIGGFVVALRTLKQSQHIVSADLALKLRATLDDAKFAKLVVDIQNHDRNSALRCHRPPAPSAFRQWLRRFAVVQAGRGRHPALETAGT